MSKETDRELAERVLAYERGLIPPVPSNIIDLIECARRLLAADAKLNEPVGEIQCYEMLVTNGPPECPRYEMIKQVNHGKGCWVKIEDHLKAMRARVPEGYVIVPKEPTIEMAEALAAAPKPE